MILKKYDYTLELTCDKCGKTKKWKNEIVNQNCGMKENVTTANREGWRIVKTHCVCPRCPRTKYAKQQKPYSKDGNQVKGEIK